MTNDSFSKVEVAIEDIRQGRMVIVVDDETRENEGDLIMAAEKVTPEAINFMARHGRGLICLPATPERLQELELDMMVDKNTALHGTTFTVSVDARDGITSGISTYDRAYTIRLLIDDATRPSDLAFPGHVFPLVACDGGVLHRPGHTEATVDLARLAGLKPAAVLCEILNADGTMARLPQLELFAEEHGLSIVNIPDLIIYRKQTERLIERVT